jgi:hypothetical protein
MPNSPELFNCGRCNKEVPRDSFYTHTERPEESDRYSMCIKCHNACNKARYEENKESVAERQKRQKRALKYEAMNYYGRVCACCGESNFWFLEVDHIENDGAEHRRKMGDKKWGGAAILRWLRKNNWPEGFQFLCSTCNQAKARYGRCPHEIRRLAINRNSGHFFPTQPKLLAVN